MTSHIFVFFPVNHSHSIMLITIQREWKDWGRKTERVGRQEQKEEGWRRDEGKWEGARQANEGVRDRVRLFLEPWGQMIQYLDILGSYSYFLSSNTKILAVYLFCGPEHACFSTSGIWDIILTVVLCCLCTW